VLANAFIGKAERPSARELAAELGPAKALWDRLLDALADDCDVREWKSYSPKAGWLLRLKRGKRAIVYLSPSSGCFMASFALGDKAVAAARESGLPARALKIVDEATRYAEGTAVRIDVRGPGDVEIVKKLAAVKLAN
jgi:hypothetical protein